MLSRDDFEYAIENTRIVLAPQSRLSTFGATLFHYHLLSEPMDVVGTTRVREGEIFAEKPSIITPDHIKRMMLEGFGERAENFLEFLAQMPENFALMRYGLRVRKQDVHTYDLRESMESALERVVSKVSRQDNPISTVIQGVEDGWEICLVKFMVETIEKSAPDNFGDFKKRGLL